MRFTQVDAFTDTPYAGNPAAVLLLPGPRDDHWMQKIAREMNLSETGGYRHILRPGSRKTWRSRRSWVGARVTRPA